jgi:hypothetical protein
MATLTTHLQHSQNWQNLYVAALMEGNQEKVPSLISAAELAIKARARELFRAEGDNIQEEESLDDALYALHALRSCLSLHGEFAEAPSLGINTSRRAATWLEQT